MHSLTAASEESKVDSQGSMSSLWQLLENAAKSGEALTVEAVCMALEADPGAATRPFTTPEAMPAVGDIVRLKPGLEITAKVIERWGSPDQLATIKDFRDMDAEIFLQKILGKEEFIWSMGSADGRIQTSYQNDFVHGFDQWLPGQAAKALDSPGAVTEAIEKAAAASS